MSKFTKKTFIQELEQLYGKNIFDFSSLNYKTVSDKIEFKCKKHGVFIAKPYWVLKRGFACKKCEQEKVTINYENEYIGKIYGSRKIVEFAGFIRPNTSTEKYKSRLWKSECINCKNIIIEELDIIKKCYVCKVCKNRPQGETGALLAYKDVKRSAKNRDIDFELTLDEFVSIAKNNCNYCNENPTTRYGIWLEWSKFHFNGIDRINNNLGYIKSNCVSCCKYCNTAKNDMYLEEWNEYLDRLCKFNS
jgi:DNA-directed RNA polymerase subunit M/transcription elongation factor TFIIS